VELTPFSNPPRGNWKETWQECLEVVRHCVYLDKDLVLPPMGTPGASETFFVVASSDLERSGIMTTRIRAQLDRVADLKTKCTVTISTVPVELDAAIRAKPLEEQIQAVAEQVTQMITKAIDRKPLCSPKSPGSN
jgi:hypothetical protein